MGVLLSHVDFKKSLMKSGNGNKVDLLLCRNHASL